MRNMQKLQNVSYLVPKGRCYSIFFWRKYDEIDKLSDSPTFSETSDEENKLKEEEIEKKRNKSRLNEPHRNIIFGNIPYEISLRDFHDSLPYKRKMFGTYGDQSKLNAAICWPTENELKEKMEYEAVAYPYTVSQIVEQHNRKVEIEAQNRLAHQMEVVKKFAKLEQWKEDLRLKIAKKETEALAAKIKKERLIEEVKKHFGYKVDTYDEKFQELLEQKQKEERKRKKAERKKAHEEKILKYFEDEAQTKSQPNIDVKSNIGSAEN